MSDLQSLIARTASFLARTASLLALNTKALVANHKKKAIAGVVLIVAGYIIKRKMTMAHLITIIQALSKFVQYLPLPDSPKLRQLAPYEHPQAAPLRAIMSAVKVQQIKARIAKKEGSWQQLKDAIFTGATMTLALYNINCFYFVVQNKYFEQFKQLKAIEPFEQAMYTIRRRFNDQLPRIFADLQRALQPELNKIDLQEVYSLQQISEIFDQLTNKVFEAKFYIREEQKKSAISKSSKETNNLFTSAFEYSPSKASSSLIARAAGGLLSFLAGSIRVFDWFPQAKQETSSQRYDFTRKAYLISLLKSEADSIKWGCEASRSLFELVSEEMGYMLLSLNFSMLVREHCAYSKKVLMNRIHLWLIANRCTSAKTVKMLPAIFKILKEEFFRDDVYQLREAYHEKELKKSVKQIALAEQHEEDGSWGIEEAVLGEIEGKKHYQYLQKQFELKYFNERSGVVHRPKRQQSQSRQSRDLQKVLSMLGGSEALNQD